LIDGNSPDDLAVFVTGSGNVDTTLNVDPSEGSEARKYPARPFSVDFISDSIYTITDLETDTVVTTRLYDGNQTITYQDVTLQLGSTPSNGDSFFVEKNLNGSGNNENLLTLIELGKQPIIEGQTFVEAYRDLVSGAGSRSRLAQLNKEAMQVVKDQAEATREAAVGVNLDEEAADLIRFQQAYQAAAQVIQISQRMFDTLIQAG
jgi:flagellar hook-associated protein 1 FlgK